MPRRTEEPFWMNAKYDGKCAECHDPVYEGERIVWDPDVGRAYCGNCGYDYIGQDPEKELESLSDNDMDDLNNSDLR